MTKNWLNTPLPTDKPLLILHPGFINQHLMLPRILNQERPTVVIALQHPNSDLRVLWSMLLSALPEQFEVQLSELDSKSTAEKAAQVFLKAVKLLPSFVLFIDAFDLADESSVGPWIAALVKGLPEGSQIILGGRTLPTSLIQNAALRELTTLFPIDPDSMLLDYVNQPSNRALLEVYGLGPGHVLVNGKRIEQWDGILPRALFFYFIDRGMVTRNEIFQTFWPTLNVREATNVFHVTKRKISEILGFDLTVYWSGFYRISPDVDLHYDVVKLVEHVQNSAVMDDADAITTLQRAIYVYRGTFLSTLDMEWAVNRREQIRLIYADALATLARLRDVQGHQHEALGLYLRAAATQPHREDLARAIMTLYDRLGQPDRALTVYQSLTKELKSRLNVAPDRRTQDLAAQIKVKA
ncbi:MAG TPA: bacterial transcriptional activator domain-containing protein [Aggregatilineales bacterium]|nr:bacterial transcriptional activator domain-containing protein [Aggregatilineales bacterium]